MANLRSKHVCNEAPDKSKRHLVIVFQNALEFEAALFEPAVIHPEVSAEIVKRHRAWLQPTLMDPVGGLMVFAFHSTTFWWTVAPAITRRRPHKLRFPAVSFLTRSVIVVEGAIALTRTLSLQFPAATSVCLLGFVPEDIDYPPVLPFLQGEQVASIRPRTLVLEHDTALAQCRDLVGRIAAASEDLVGMLTKGRGRSWRRSRYPVKLDRLLHRAIPPELRMIERRNEILGEHLRMVEHVLDRAHRRTGLELAEKLFQFEGRPRGER